MVEEAKNKFGRIGVLMGGPSSEREISLKSGKGVYEAFLSKDIEVVALDIKTDNATEVIKLLRDAKIDCAFIAMHGRFGEDGQIQQILDQLSIPYTGSGALAASLAMDKISARKIFSSDKLPSPRYLAFESKEKAAEQIIKNLKFPVVVKPATQGSSIGLNIAENNIDLFAALEEAFRYDERVLVEEFISGREITVGILDELPLPVVEIVTKRKFFDYTAKYQAGFTEYIVPAHIDNSISVMVQELALRAHKLLGCKGFSRVDFILDDSGVAFILEINAIPGLTPFSLLPKAAAACGIDFTSLCLKLIEIAYAENKRLSCASAS